ncbi:S-layer homology domain-containing protein [uncultured Oscillibacter sp.]|uniref:S-layer homology domain-containing protein n=1 Tax=uncultured Oscillibacter sp. TaxID=876091 RepID=UPI00260FECA1|nr:S-layer homology domain-containing protein [uncultured Oscillibacter sp.]
MKKFLSLVLALVMTMSLVTVSAGATEYKDLTDKDEIQYEEAVAVLNRIGIITGYTDGSFQPKKELTRGAAAKIIVSLMIGSEAASNLVAASAPYTDVPVNHTFAGVISYCKNSGYINGYQDGSFKPEGTLSGYAFAKMLLGALGYKGEHEGGFTGAGWTMNVARIGNECGLFDRLSFKGNESVNREQACQLALNTLKGTLVEYTGGMNIVNGTQSVVVNPERNYKVSNQEFASHINNKKASGNSNYDKDNWYTVEFGEEHFVDLRMKQERSTEDDFGRPSNEWSYKKVTIGTYPVEADFTYTEQMEHDVTGVSDATKVRALGLNGYKVDGSTELHVNGETSTPFGGEKVGDIADYTDNGTVVEVYVSEDTADYITDVVVVKTQLMEVKRVGADSVTLDVIKPDNKTAKAESGYNQAPIFEDVEDVESDNANYEFLKGLKAGDLVAVVPVTTDNGTEFEVYDAYTPETVEGKLTRVKTYGNSNATRQAVEVTVGGTAYKVSLWNKDLVEINADDIKVTREDVKLYLDKAGNALRAKNVGDTSDYFVIKGYFTSTIDRRNVTIVEGWDIKGNLLELNLGTNTEYTSSMKPGDLVKYTNKGVTGSADWKLVSGLETVEDVTRGVTDVYTGTDSATNAPYEIKASNNRIAYQVGANPVEKPYTAKGVKFIYVSFNDDGSEVDSIEVLSGVQNASNADLTYKWNSANYNPAQLCLNDDGEVEAVVIKRESNQAISTNLLYIRDWDGSYEVDSTGKKIYGYTVAMMTPDGLKDKEFIYSDKELDVGDFASYSAATREGFEPFYTLREHTSVKKTTSVNEAKVYSVVNADKHLVKLTDYAVNQTNIAFNLSASLGIGDETHVVRMADAEWLDLTRNGINSVGDLKDFVERAPADGGPKYPVIQFIYNDDSTKDAFRNVSLVIITEMANSVTTVPDVPIVDETIPVPAPGQPLDPSVKDDLDGKNLTIGNVEYPPVHKDTPSDPAVKIALTEAAGHEGVYDFDTKQIDVTVTPEAAARAAGDPVVFACTKANGRLVKVTEGSAAVDAVNTYTAVGPFNDEAAFNAAKTAAEGGKLYKLADGKDATAEDFDFTDSTNFAEATYVAAVENPDFYQWDATLNNGSGAWKKVTFETKDEFDQATNVKKLAEGKTEEELLAADETASGLIEEATWAKVEQPTYYKIVVTPAEEAVAAVWNIVLTAGDLTAEGITGAFSITAIAEHADPVS